MKLLMLSVVLTTELFAMVCKQETMPSICGSGEVVLVMKENDYYLRNGDVGCWFTDLKFSGVANKIANSGYDVPSDHYKILEDRADIFISEDKLKAVIKLKDNEKFMGLRGREYILDCTNEDEVKHHTVYKEFTQPSSTFEDMLRIYKSELRAEGCKHPVIVGEPRFYGMMGFLIFESNYYCYSRGF